MDGSVVVLGQVQRQTALAPQADTTVLLGFQDRCQAGAELTASDAVVAHVELLEDHLVERPLEAGASGLVEPLRICQQIQGHLDVLTAGVKLVHGGGELAPKIHPFGLNGGELFLDLGPGPGRVADQIEVLLFAGVESLEPVVNLPTDPFKAAELIFERLVKLLPDTSAEVIAQSHSGVVTFDVPLDLAERQVGLVTAECLLAAASEVEVGAAVSLAALDDHARAACAAPQHTIEVVVIASLACAVAAVQCKNPLHPAEECLIDERLVPSLVLLAFVADVAQVVAVGQ